MKKAIYFLLVLLSCSCNQNTNKVDNEELEKSKRDSIMKRQRTLAQDSISKLGDKIFSDFYFGMSKSEFEKAKAVFKEETNGYVKIEDLKFYLYNPSFEKEKLTCLALGATDKVMTIQGMSVYTDYASILKERYTNRLGLPDLFLDKEYQECDSTSKNLAHILWIFDNRVLHLSFSKVLNIDKNFEMHYWIYYSTKEDWLSTKETFDNMYRERLRKVNERREKDKKYSDEL